jgi:hypothetical protein
VTDWDPVQVVAAIRLLAACDHFDNSRHAARTIPADIPLVDLLRAADGATRLARELDIIRRIAA